jgi:WD40 repeat protein
MRFFCIAFLALVFSIAASAQVSDRNFQFKGKFDMDNPSEGIIAYDLFENGEKLRLVGEKSIQIWDVKNNKVLDARRHEIENLWLTNSGVRISPDRGKVFVPAYRRKSGEQKDAPKIIIPGKVYDLNTGKLIAALDKNGKLASAAVWSKNGKTLVTASDEDFAGDSAYRFGGDGTEILGNNVGEIDVSFWDGETLELRASIAVSNLTWRYLSLDGEKLLTTSGPKRNMLGVNYASEKASTIDVWNTQTGKLEKQLSIGDETFFTRTRKLMVNPDGRTLALILKSRKTDADDRMLVWDIYGSDEAPKYVLKANPKIDDSELGYSPDGKLVALDSGKNAQFYEISTGAKKFEMADFEVPDFWFVDNKVALFHKDDKILGVEIPSGKTLFEKEVFYRTATRGLGTYMTDDKGNMTENTETYVVDYTRIVPHPNNRFFIAYSNQSVRIHDALSGDNLRSLVIPPPVIERKKKVLGVTVLKFRDYGKNLVTRAAWSGDGKWILILDAEAKSVSLWEMKE